MKRKKTKNVKRSKKKNTKTKRIVDFHSLKNIKATLKNYKSLKNKYKIKDVPFSKNISKGTRASCRDINFHYQNYSNVLNFFKSINFGSMCLFKNSNPFLNLNINDLKLGLVPINQNIKHFKSNIKECMKSKKQFIPIILNLVTSDGNHANILLIDKKDKLIELYEPHGSRVSSSELGGVIGAYKKKINAVRNFWKPILSDFKVVNVVDYKRGTAFQMERDPENHSGFCVTWTILFIHYRLLNPKVKLSSLINYISLRITTIKLLQYAKYIEDTIKGKQNKI
mgnify:CR=1 FL=1